MPLLADCDTCRSRTPGLALAVAMSTLSPTRRSSASPLDTESHDAVSSSQSTAACTVPVQGQMRSQLESQLKSRLEAAVAAAHLHAPDLDVGWLPHDLRGGAGARRVEVQVDLTKAGLVTLRSRAQLIASCE